LPLRYWKFCINIVASGMSRSSSNTRL
jgi:hypothetical protein